MKIKPKVVMMGDASVGKTSIVNKWLTDSFNTNVYPTVGAAFSKGYFEYKDKKEEVQVWDTAGEEKFQSMAPIYSQGAFGCILVFDLTNRKSFEKLSGWVSVARHFHDLPIVLCGNKYDLIDGIEVEEKEAIEFANSIQASFFFTSAKNGFGIKEAFFDILSRGFKYKEELEESGADGISLDETSHRRRCC